MSGRKRSPQAPAEAEMVYLGRSGTTPLRLKARLAARDRVEAQAAGGRAWAEASLWACAPRGWAVSLQIDADGAASAHAARAPDRAAAIAEAAALTRRALDAPCAGGEAPVSLSAAAEAACRRYARARLARALAERVAAALSSDRASA